ncbi:hypothetical protein J6590_056418 [Homalodisca vitripennis]|nr:hypothetical protein J6590_056418 [Homalodisca vitripennis]
MLLPTVFSLKSRKSKILSNTAPDRRVCRAGRAASAACFMRRVVCRLGLGAAAMAVNTHSYLNERRLLRPREVNSDEIFAVNNTRVASTEPFAHRKVTDGERELHSAHGH